MSETLTKDKIDFLKLLAQKFPSKQKVAQEIVNLSAILNLPKGTEHFLSDVHGEYESFIHVIKNASGVIRNKINDAFQYMEEKEKNTLAILVYYPKEKLSRMELKTKTKGFYDRRIKQLVALLRKVALKYTRSKVRKAFPEDYGYIIEELIQEKGYTGHADALQREMVDEYYQSIIDTVVQIKQADQLIIAMCETIQRLAIDRLHVVGDIWDRGPGAEHIVDFLMTHHNVDIQWGNHDIVWMGAAAGSMACIANNVRTSVRYSNMKTLEEGYGISLSPVANLARKYYGKDPCKYFQPKSYPKDTREEDIMLFARMQKAMAVIQEKLEAQIVKAYPEFGMEHRLLLENINTDTWTVQSEGKECKLRDTHFPTVDWTNPTALNEDEQEVMDTLVSYHINSEKLQRHVQYLFDVGSMYLKCNGNLLYHGLCPMKSDGTYMPVKLCGKEYTGKRLYKVVEKLCRSEYFDKENAPIKEIMWWLWCGPTSPLFGKHKMATFERYWLDDKDTHKEISDPYFKLRDTDKLAGYVLTDFGLDPASGHIISGHIPVKVKGGEDPVKGKGQLLCIDGGFSEAYQQITGIAGYTLISNSKGLILTQHTTFPGAEAAMKDERDMLHVQTILERAPQKAIIKNTDIGMQLLKEIDDLKLLLACYRDGTLIQPVHAKFRFFKK